MTDRKHPTGAQVRGQIQSGDTGDIRSGFDPAAAPMETDAEAEARRSRLLRLVLPLTTTLM
jgi:hypothetical protein